jgi:tetratricopeptide (TPR) repeat protein
MECRKSLFLALTLCAGACGCGSLLPTRIASSEPPAGSEEKQHKPATYVAFADFRASSSFAEGINPAQQQQLREEARRSYLKAIEIDPKHLPAYVGLARLQQACENHAGAAATYERAVQVAPQDAGLWFAQGMCQCRVRNWDAAVQCLHKACDLDPGDRQYSTTLGLTLARAGMYNESFAVLARQYGEARAHSDLARMLHHLHQPELARQQATLALSKDPAQQAARELLAALDKAGANGRPTQPGQKQGIQLAAYNEPPAPAQPVERDRTIRVPPLPVISIHSKSD